MISDVRLSEMEEGESLRYAVYHSLKKAIMTGVLLPDERLMEVPIATQLGVSRTPVREAIQMLVREQLAITSPRCGARVAGITDKEVKDALDVRISVEIMSVRFAIQNITPEQITRLRDINAKIEAAILVGDVARISDLDNLLHRVIGETSGNNVLMDIMKQLEEHVLRYRIEYIKTIQASNAIANEHERIIAAIENKDVEAATDYMMKHIQKQREQICQIIYDKKK